MADIKEITASEIERLQRDSQSELERLWAKQDTPSKRISFLMSVNNFAEKYLYRGAPMTPAPEILGVEFEQ